MVMAPSFGLILGTLYVLFFLWSSNNSGFRNSSKWWLDLAFSSYMHALIFSQSLKGLIGLNGWSPLSINIMLLQPRIPFEFIGQLCTGTSWSGFLNAFLDTVYSLDGIKEKLRTKALRKGSHRQCNLFTLQSRGGKFAASLLLMPLFTIYLVAGFKLMQ